MGSDEQKAFQLTSKTNAMVPVCTHPDSVDGKLYLKRKHPLTEAEANKVAVFLKAYYKKIIEKWKTVFIFHKSDVKRMAGAYLQVSELHFTSGFVNTRNQAKEIRNLSPCVNRP